MKIVRLQVRKRRDGIEMIDGACEGVTEGYRDTLRVDTKKDPA